MSDDPKGREDSGLFDLPLQPRKQSGNPDAGGGPTRRRRRPPAAIEEPELPLFDDNLPAWDAEPDEGLPEAAEVLEPLPPMPAIPAPAAAAPPGPVPIDPPSPPAASESPRRGRAPATFRPRLVAAAVDAAVHLGVAALGLTAAVVLGVPLALSALPAVALFLLAFSFLYSVVTLAFWGQTPGMVAAGLVARGDDDHPLTFGQTGLRWLAGLLTVALAGLPLLVALTGRSLADRLSGSQSYSRGG